MRCGGGSFVGGRGTRICRSGIGRPCYRHGRRAYPIHQNIELVIHNKSITNKRGKIRKRGLPFRLEIGLRFPTPAPTPSRGWGKPPKRGPDGMKFGGNIVVSYLARVDPLSGKRVVVGPHFVVVVWEPAEICVCRCSSWMRSTKLEFPDASDFWVCADE